MGKKILLGFSVAFLFISLTISLISFGSYLKIKSNKYDLTNKNYSPETKMVLQQELGEIKNTIINLSVATAVATTTSAASFVCSFMFKKSSTSNINKNFK